MTLVVGATGALGGEICARLLSRGVSVRALVRPDSPGKRDLDRSGVETIDGDLNDPPSLETACSGANCVVSTASAMSSRRDGDKLKNVDLTGHVSLVRAAKSVGVEHFVYTSISSEANPRAVLVRYKRRIERVVRESGMAWTVLQPAAFMESMFKPSSGWDIDEGRVKIIGPGTALFNPVSRDDVAEFAALSVVRDDLKRRVIPVGGPDVVSALDVVEVFAEVSGRELKVTHLSAAKCRFSAWILQYFNPALSSIYALAAGNLRDNVIDMALVLSEIPVGLTTIRQFAQRQFSGSETPPAPLR